jgi:D-glycerate 3-kinase
VDAKVMTEQSRDWQQGLLERHGLEASYLAHAQKWFDPLVELLATHQKRAPGPLLVAINGSQGSGKTTLSDYLRCALEANFGLRTVTLSLDDVYHTRAARERLAVKVHPLLITRGVPGTHDMALLQHTLDLLLDGGRREPVPVPRFDKAADDRLPRSRWDVAEPGTRVVLLEGWCLGAVPQTEAELEQPVNELERDEDPDGRWRRYVNLALAREFEPLYQRVSEWVMLCAPDFDCVYRWRLEQERKLAQAAGAGSAQHIMDEAGIARFIQFFQRLTSHCLQTLPARVDHLYQLDRERNIVACQHASGESR